VTRADHYLCELVAQDHRLTSLIENDAAHSSRALPWRTFPHTLETSLATLQPADRETTKNHISLLKLVSVDPFPGCHTMTPEPAAQLIDNILDLVY
jgi:hypothetical protein